MKFGNIDSPVSINDLYSVVEDTGELSSSVSSYTFSNLDGDTDEEYILLSRFRNVSGSTTTYYIRFNGDTGANYGQQDVQGEGAVIAGSGATGLTWINIGGTATGYLSMSALKIYAKSGKSRVFRFDKVFYIHGTSINNFAEVVGAWNNTGDNITSITVVTNPASGLGAGSRLVLLKKVTASTMKHGLIEPQGLVYGIWEKIYEYEVSGSAITSFDISSLDGNGDVYYMLNHRLVSGFAGGFSIAVRPNNDTGATNYGYQYIRGSSTTISAFQGSADRMSLGGGGGTGQLSCGTWLLHAKSGYERTAIVHYSQYISGTTITYTDSGAQSWIDTSNNITSLRIFASQTNGIGIGSHFELWRLNL